ncbi:peptidylprolyl isomerase [Oscillospiraceae bacterium CM]|nr:peptidylprolyl isomerase [Oscillospiraceae bacterium CM]
MLLKKVIAVLLCTVLTAALLAGCGKTSDKTTGDNGAAEAKKLNYAAAYAAIDPKTVMLTINGADVTWDQLFYNIYTATSNLAAQGESITDWAALNSDNVSYQDAVLNEAFNIALQSAAVRYGAKELKLALTKENIADIQAKWDAQVSAAGGEAALLSQLRAQYSSKEIFNNTNEVGALAQDCFKKLYGEKGDKLSDKEIADYTANDGYMMTKHILMLTTTTDENGKSQPVSDTDKAAVYQKMQDILAKLKAYKGKDFDTYFDSLMHQYSEDPGLATYPDGYLFQSGDMVSQFEDTTKALEIGRFSDIIETSYGYHIIYRIPVDYNATPASYSGSGYSLRFLTAYNMFVSVINNWTSSLNVTKSADYQALDFNKLFAN